MYVYVWLAMTSRSRYNFFIDDEQREALRFVKEQTGVSESEQIRRAIRAWIESRGALKNSAPRRAPTRRKA
jgi:hypothetical protein